MDLSHSGTATANIHNGELSADEGRPLPNAPQVCEGVDAKTTLGRPRPPEDAAVSPSPDGESMAALSPSLHQVVDAKTTMGRANVPRKDSREHAGAPSVDQEPRLHPLEANFVLPVQSHASALANPPAKGLLHLPGAFRVEPNGITRVASPTSHEEESSTVADVRADERAGDPVIFPATLASFAPDQIFPEAVIPKATEVDPDQMVPCLFRRRTVALLLLAVCTLCVAAAVITGVLVSGSNQPSPFDEFMTSSWSIDTRPIAKNDTTSPQAEALQWLKRDLQYTTWEPWRMRQRYALAVFYFALNGQWWLNNTGWLSSADECSWYSDEEPCDENNRYIRLALPTNNISGTIPPDFGYLSYLRRIQLSTNFVLGTVPTVIASMVQLRELEMDHNVLSGRMPTFLGMLTSLEIVVLSSNHLTGQVPSELGLLTNLTDVYLEENRLDQTIPTQIWQHKNVSLLILDSNLLVGSIPTEIGLMQNLTVFSVGRNFFVGKIPTEIGLITTLVELYLNGNSFTGTVPSEL
jgi:hypothetical protein